MELKSWLISRSLISIRCRGRGFDRCAACGMTAGEALSFINVGVATDSIGDNLSLQFNLRLAVYCCAGALALSPLRVTAHLGATVLLPQLILVVSFRFWAGAPAARRL